MATRLIVVLFAGLMASAAQGADHGVAEEAQRHPGRMGYLKSGGEAGGVPILHRYTGPGGPAYVPFPYPDGPGGWGEAVSELVAECGGLPGVHDPDCDPAALP